MADRRGFTNLYQNIPVQPLAGYSDPSAFIRVRDAIRGVEDQLVQIRGLVGTTQPGFVTSVGLTAPTIFTVTGSPVTTSGTIALSLASQSARSAFIAPTSVAGAPTFRALETADIQSGTFGVSRGGTGFSTYTTGDILYSDAANSLAKLAVGYTGQVLKVSGGVPTWAADVGFANPMTTLGDLIYGGALGVATKLAGDTTNTRKFLLSLSVAGTATAPVWDTVSKTDVGLSNVENTALSTWAGSTAITTLGTVGTGTWSATSIAPAKGGTGLTTAPAQDVIVYGGGTTSFSTLAPPSSGTQVLTWTSGIGITWTTKPVGTVTSVTATSPISSSGGATPDISLGTVLIANGGTGITSYATGDLLYFATGTALSKLTLTTGGVMYGGASAPAWTATTDLTWDNTNKRLGIGIASPAYQLDVVKSQNASTDSRLASNGDTGVAARAVGFVSTTTASMGVYAYGSGYTTVGAQVASGTALAGSGTGGMSIVATDASGAIRLYTAGTAAANERLRITATGDFGLGAGASSPAYAFDFRKNTAGVATFGLTNTDSGSTSDIRLTLFGDTGNGGLIQRSSMHTVNPNDLLLYSTSHALRFYTANTLRATVGSTGNVGIGVASPSYPFHVASTITSTSGTVLSYSSATIAPSSSPAAGSYFGQYSLIQSSGANATGTLTAVYGEAYNSGSSTLTWLRGVSSALGIGASATGNVTSAASFYAFSPVQVSPSMATYTTAYGVYIGAQKVASVTGVGYGVYAPGTSDLNTLAGKLRVGSTADPTNALDVTGAATVSGSFTVATNAFAIDSTTKHAGVGTASPGVRLDVSETAAISSSATFSAAAIRMNPAYTATGTITVKHRYLHFTQPTISGGTTTFTEAYAMYFDAAAGTHRAVDSGTTKSTPGTVNAWVKIEINGLYYFIPAYSSKTA